MRLICNAAEGLLQLILVRDGALLCSQAWPAPTRSTEMMAPALAHMLQELGCSCQDMTHIACVYGPGSFTGIRLVLSTAAALRRALHIPVAPLDYMEALALSASLALQATPRLASLPLHATTPQPATPAASPAHNVNPLWVLTHARRNLVHAQAFTLPPQTRVFSPSTSTALPTPLAPVDLYSLEDCAHNINTLHTSETPPLVIGSGLLRNLQFFTQHCPAALFAACDQTSTEALCLLAQHATYVHQDPTPLYIRPCDAVENLPAMAQRQGQDPTQSQSQLDQLLQRPATPDISYRP